MIIATAGHVDHGKTKLVHALTGIETDRLEEERNRGLTIDLGFAYIDDELGGRLGFIDVPGHIKFINNMLAGVGAIDFALLVIAADDGPMPQTVEHLAILDQLGIALGAVALTKIDRVDSERVTQVGQQITDLLAPTSLREATIYPVSSLTGEGIEDLKTTLCLTAAELDTAAPDGHFRLAIDRCFTVKGSGLVVTGSVFSGAVSEGDALTLVPLGESVRVRSIHTQNQPATRAQKGDRCAINIATHNLSREHVSRGNWLTSNAQHLPTNRFDVRIRVLASETRPLRHWTPVHIHSAANHIHGRLATLQASRFEPGETGFAQLVCSEAINLCMGDRIILRDQGANRTIAGGVVLDPFSPARGRNRPERVAYLAQLSSRDPQHNLTVMLASAPTGINRTRTCDRLNLRDHELESYLTLTPSCSFSETLIEPVHLEQLILELLQKLDDWHRDNPHSKGLSRNQIAHFLARGVNFVDELIDHLVANEELIKSGNVLQRPGFSAQLPPDVLKVWEKVEPLLSREPTRPPVLHEVASQLGLPPKQIEKALRECLAKGLVVRPVANRYFLPVAMDELHQLLSRAADQGQLTVKQYRDVTGIGRNLAIEILEYFDGRGITQRQGDQRKIIKPFIPPAAATNQE